MNKKKMVISACMGVAIGTVSYQAAKQIKVKRNTPADKGKEIAIPRRLGIYEKYIKRPLDFCCALTAAIVLSPVMLVTAILVRIKLGSPVIFTQERPGLNGKVFKLYKFRTMTDKRDENGELLPDAERLTKFGAHMRSMSIDELPELWNILKGDCSCVGPRPWLIRDYVFMDERQKHRQDVRPGLTGLAQVSGRNNISWEERMEYDLQYIENITFIGDMKIILKTIDKVLRKSDIVHEGTVSDMDYGDWLLNEGKIGQEEYDKGQEMAMKIRPGSETKCE